MTYEQAQRGRKEDGGDAGMILPHEKVAIKSFDKWQRDD